MTTQKSKSRGRTAASSRSKTQSKSLTSQRKNTSIRVARRRTYPVHKRVLLHPIGIFFILCIGVLICGWTYRVVANTVISSVIEAPPLQAGAIITSPSDKSHTTSVTVTVKGECPTNSYVKLTLNDAFTGVAWCQPDNTFSIQTSLRSGKNVLSAQDYNQTDSAGPESPDVGVTYDEPVDDTSNDDGSSGTTTSGSDSGNTTSKTPSNPANSGSLMPTKLPILLSSDFQFHTFTAKQLFTWNGSLEGGLPPYNLYIDWGDGTSSHMYFPVDPPFTLKHAYKSPGYYPIVMKSVDSRKQTHVMQLAALITDNLGHAGFLSPTGGNSAASSASLLNSSNVANKKWLLLAWPSYLIVVLMTISFLLGERQQHAQATARIRR